MLRIGDVLQDKLQRAMTRELETALVALSLCAERLEGASANREQGIGGQAELEALQADDRQAIAIARSLIDIYWKETK
jgi:hypothetical protein